MNEAELGKIVIPDHKSSYSGAGGSGGCVERAGFSSGTQRIRDSKDPQRKVALYFSSASWGAFVSQAKETEVEV